MNGKRILASFLCLVLTLGMVADTTVFAAEGQDTVSGGNAEVEIDTVTGNDIPTPGDEAGDASGNEQGTAQETEEPTESGTTVSENDNANLLNQSSVSGNDMELASTEVLVESSYTIDENGVLTTWPDAAGSITIPSEVTSIGEGVFMGNTAITSVTVSEGATSIGKDAFKNCTKLETVRLPKSMETIGESAFEGCSVLYMVYLQEPDYAKLHTIGDRAFADCTNLGIFLSKGEFVLTESITSIGSRAFTGCQKITKVVLPKKLSSMGEGVFAGCQHLQEVTLSTNYVTIPADTFSGCYDLISIHWASTQTISERAFQNCESLTVLTIPSTVTTIKAGAFMGCSELSFVIFDNDAVSLINAIFSDGHTTTLCASAGSKVDIYQQQYAYLKFVSKADANKTAYGVNGDRIKKALPGVNVFCYTVEITSEGVEKYVEVTKAKTGTQIFVEIQNIPNGYALVEDSLKVNGELLSKNDKGVYFFNQKQGGAFLTADFMQTKYLDTLGTVNYETSESIEEGMKIGQTVQLYLYSSRDSLEKPLNGARFSFKDYNSKKLKIAVDAQGRISLTAKEAGTTTIGIYNNYNSEKVKEIEVLIKSTPLQEMDLHIAKTSDNIKIDSTDSDGTKNVKVDLNALKIGKGESMVVKANGWDADGTPLNVAYKWTTSDSSIAKLSKSSTTVADTSNTIQIPKGTKGGEVTITVEAQDGTKMKRHIHVMVVDGKPSLKLETGTFNFYKENPMVLSLIEAYGYGVDNTSLVLYDVGKEENISRSKLFTIEPDLTAGQYVIRAKNNELVKDGSYKVVLDGETNGENGHFSIPFTITVKNVIPSAQVKQTGKINLFYSTQGAAQEVVTTISGYGDAAIAKYELENLQDSKGKDTALQADYNKFTENFAIDSRTGVISRKADKFGVYESGSSKGKNVVTGYMAIYFEGYTEPRKVKINVATETKKPSYVLEKTSGTYNISKGTPDSEIVLPVYEKQGKTLVPVALSADGYDVTYNFDKSTGLFKTVSPNLSIENDKIIISVEEPDSISANGKLVLNLKNAVLWGDSYLELTYTVKTSKTLPKISLSTTKVTLNSIYDAQEAEFTLKTNQPDCGLLEEQTFEPVYSKKKEYNEAIDKIEVTYQNGQGLVKLPEGETIAAGTYKFSCDVQADDVYWVNNASRSNLNRVTLSVVVKNTVPTMKPKSSKFTLNSMAKGSENAKQPLTFKNAPAESSGYSLSKLNVLSGDTSFVEFDLEDGMLTAKMKADYQYNVQGTFSYEICPVWTKADEEVVGGKVKITVVIQNKMPDATLGSAKGKLDLLNREVGIAYSVSVKNVNDTIANPKLYELDAMGNPEKTESDCFYGTVEDGKLVVRAKQDAEIVSGKTYSFKIRYELETVNKSYTMQKTLKIKPTQTFPKLTQSATTVNLYQSNRDYYATVTVTAKEKSTAHITGVEWAKDASSGIKDSFTYEVIDVDDTKNTVTLKLTVNKNYQYAVGKTQTLKFAVQCEGQDEATYGTSFTVKAVVNR